MVAYRFCRPDDLPLIARAVNDCYRPHFPAEPPTSLDSLKREAQEVDLWASSCMIATDGDGPLAVVTGAKRPGVTLIQRVGVRPGNLGRGHGSHLLQSLAAKLAILGPPAMVAEVPYHLPRVAKLFERLDYRPGRRFTDYRLSRQPEPVSASGAIHQVALKDLDAASLLDDGDDLAWARQKATLVNRADQLRGWALVSATAIEAFCLYRTDSNRAGTAIARLGAADPRRADLLLPVLLRFLSHREPMPLWLPRLCDSELNPRVLTGLGFEATATYRRYTTEAMPLA